MSGRTSSTSTHRPGIGRGLAGAAHALSPGSGELGLWSDPEFSLLVRCVAHARGLHATPTLPVTSQTNLNCNRLLRLANQHKVTQDVLSSNDAHWWPESGLALARLRKSSLAKRSIGNLLMDQWRRITLAFEREGISYISLKGPALSIQLYGDPGVREYRDLDFFVDLADSELLDIVPLLRGLGYEMVEPPPSTSEIPHHLPGFQLRDLPVFVEIHGRRGLSQHGKFTVPREEVLRRTMTMRWLDHDYHTLAEDHHALFLLAHGVHHAWSTLGWIADAARVFSNDRDWQGFWNLARSSGMTGSVLTSLYAARRVFRFPLEPIESFATARQIRRARTTAVYAKRALSSPADDQLNRLRKLSQAYFYHGRIDEVRLARLRAVATLFAPVPADRTTMPLPNALAFLLWFIRPLLVILRAQKRRRRLPRRQ